MSETERPCELDVYSDSTAGRHVPTDRRRQSTPSGITLLVDSGTAEVEIVSSEQRDDWRDDSGHSHEVLRTLNLRFLVKGLSSLMVAGFLVHCANADVEAVSGEAGLNAVNIVTDSQDWQSIPIVWLVLLLAMLMSFGLDCCFDWFSIVCCTWFGHHGESESFGSVLDAVSSTLETKPRMPMRDVTEHEMETERARRGLLSTLHADIETSCRMGGLHISGSKRVRFDGTLSIERRAQKVRRLRSEAAAGGLVVQVELGDLEPRSRSWMVRPSAPGIMKARQASRKRDRRKPANGSS